MYAWKQLIISSFHSPISIRDIFSKKLWSVQDGVLTCSLHGWQWELATGACLTSDGHHLYARPAGQEDDDAPKPVDATPPLTVSHDSETAAAEESGAEVEPGAA